MKNQNEIRINFIYDIRDIQKLFKIEYFYSIGDFAFIEYRRFITIQSPELEYEYTLVFDLDIKNHACASKDRTGLFFGKPEQKLKIESGK